MFSPEIMEPLKKDMKMLNPDLVIVDYFSVYALRVADELGLPAMCNSQFPLAFLSLGNNAVFPESNRTQACCGCLCICPVFLEVV